jgi:MoaA/NifB/PqqE/SkfB family radical SAM enzyme
VTPVFSVDGFEETNDRWRGQGVFQKITAAMRKMKEARIVFGFSTVVHKENLKEVISERYLGFMIDSGCFIGGFLPYIPVGDSPRHDVICSSTEVADYYRELDRISTGRPILVLKEGFSDGSFLNDGCGAGNTMHITSRGEAEPCNGIEFFVDRVQEKSLKELMTSDYFNDIRRLNDENGNRCIAITRPESVLQIVKKHGARATHEKALEHLEEYVSRRAKKPAAAVFEQPRPPG